MIQENFSILSRKGNYIKLGKLIDFGTWTNEEKLISRPIESEDFYQE